MEERERQRDWNMKELEAKIAAGKLERVMYRMSVHKKRVRQTEREEQRD